MRVTLLFTLILFSSSNAFGQFYITQSILQKPILEETVYVCKGDSTKAIWQENSIEPATIKWYKNGKLIKTGTNEIYFTEGVYEIEGRIEALVKYPYRIFRVLETTSPNVRLLGDDYFVKPKRACGNIPIFGIEVGTYHSNNHYSKILSKNKEEILRPYPSSGRYGYFQSTGMGEYAVTISAGACSATYELGKIETESTTDTVQFYFNEELIGLLQDTLKICGKFESELSINSRNNSFPYDWFIDGELAFKGANRITPQRSGWYHAEYASQGCLRIVKKIYISIGDNIEPLRVSYRTGSNTFHNCQTKKPDFIYLSLRPQNFISAITESQKALFTVKDVEANTVHAQYNGDKIFTLNEPIKFNRQYEVNYKFENCETRSTILVEQREMKISVQRSFPASENLCNNSGVRLSASQLTNGYINTESRIYTLTWFRNGVEFAQTENGEYILATVSGDYHVEAFYENCTFTSEKITINLPTYIPTNLTVSDIFLSCTESNTVIKAPEVPEGFTYKWYKELKNDFGNNISQLIPTQTDITFQVSKGSEGAYYAVMSDGRCSVKTATTTINKVDVEVGNITIRKNNIGIDEVCNTSPAVLTTNTNNDVTWAGPNGFSSQNKEILVEKSGVYKLSVKNKTTGCVYTDSVSVAITEKPAVTLTVENQICVGEPVLIKITAEKPDGDFSSASFKWNGFANPSQSISKSTAETSFYSRLTYQQYKANNTLNFELINADRNSCFFAYGITPTAKPELAVCKPEISLSGLKPFYCDANSVLLKLNFTDKTAQTKPYKVYASYQFSEGVTGEIGGRTLLGEFTGETLELSFDLLRPNLNYYLIFEQEGKVIYVSSQPLKYIRVFGTGFSVFNQFGQYLNPLSERILYQCDIANPLSLEPSPSQNLQVIQSTQWYFNEKKLEGEKLEGETGQRITPTVAGYYSAQVQIDGCPVSTDYVQVIIGELPPVFTEITPSVCTENGVLISAIQNNNFSYINFGSYNLLKDDSLFIEDLNRNTDYHLKEPGTYRIQGRLGNCTSLSAEKVIGNTKNINDVISNPIYVSTRSYLPNAQICKSENASIWSPYSLFQVISKWNLYSERESKPDLEVKTNLLLNGKVTYVETPYSAMYSGSPYIVNQSGDYQMMLTQGSCSSLSNKVNLAVKESIPLELQANSPYFGLNLRLIPRFYADSEVNLYHNGVIERDVYRDERSGGFANITKPGTYTIKSPESTCYTESNKVIIKELPKSISLIDTIYTCSDSVYLYRNAIDSVLLSISSNYDYSQKNKTGWYQSNGVELSQNEKVKVRSPGEYLLKANQDGLAVEVKFVVLKIPDDFYELTVATPSSGGLYCENETVPLKLTAKPSTNYFNTQRQTGLREPWLPSFEYRTGNDYYFYEQSALPATIQVLKNGGQTGGMQRYLSVTEEGVFDVKDEGNYQIEVQIDGCTYKTNTVTVEKKPFPLTLSPNLPQVSICPTGGFQTLELTPGYTYQWLKNEAVLENNSAALKATSAGNYFAIASADGCTRISPQVKIVEKNETPTATISGDSTIAAGATAFLNLNYTASPPFTYQLSGGLSGVSEKMFDKIAVSPRETTVFKFISVKNSCGNGTVNTTASATITVEPLILSNEELLNSSFNLYPVPLVDELTLTIDLDVPQTCSFWLYNLSGSELANQQIGKVSVYNQSLDLAHLPAGAYIFKIQIGNQFHHRKIVKK
jgi:hypothetical protein